MTEATKSMTVTLLFKLNGNIDPFAFSGTSDVKHMASTSRFTTMTPLPHKGHQHVNLQDLTIEELKALAKTYKP